MTLHRTVQVYIKQKVMFPAIQVWCEAWPACLLKALLLLHCLNPPANQEWKHAEKKINLLLMLYMCSQKYIKSCCIFWKKKVRNSFSSILSMNDIKQQQSYLNINYKEIKNYNNCQITEVTVIYLPNCRGNALMQQSNQSKYHRIIVL